LLLLAAKQEAFEESMKLKNQFRALNDDEAEFLDSQYDAAKAKEEATRKETNEQLEVFKRRQVESNNVLNRPDAEGGSEQELEASTPNEIINWGMNSKKRKRVKENELLKGIKAKKPSVDVKDVEQDNTSAKADKGIKSSEEAKAPGATHNIEENITKQDTIALKPQKPGVALVSYDSGDDD
jgi:hypothetical protein